MSVKEILTQVRDKVDKTHWIKGDYYQAGWGDEKDRGCLVGLVNIAAGSSSTTAHLTTTTNTDRNEALALLWRNIPGLEDENEWGQLEDWNDSVETEREDVLDLIDRALAQVES